MLSKERLTGFPSLNTRNIVISLLGVALISSYIFIQSEKRKQPLVASSEETKVFQTSAPAEDLTTRTQAAK
jgi:hypothetical protein